MRWVLTLTGASLLVMACVFPDMFIFGKRSFMILHDTEIPFENTFALTTYLYHGGLQLWDRFDQMNLSYFQLSAGIYTLANMATAMLYWLISPLFSYSAEAFHRIQTWGFFSFTTFIRVLGGFLLLRQLKVPLLANTLANLLLNTVLLSYLFLGVLTDNLYSYFPLLLYVLVRILEGRRIIDIAWLGLLTAIMIANSPLFALGYFYVVVHFFILALLVFVLLDPVERSRSWQWPTGMGQWRLMLLIALGAVIILLPQIVLSPSLKTDFFIAHSGLSGDDGRMRHMFDINRYFDPTGKGFISPKDFLVKAIDYQNNSWRDSWIFYGVSTLFLTALGIFLSSRRIKWVFVAGIMAIFLINVQPHLTSPLSIGHWINALTNPFNFLLRSFHMSTLLMPFLFFPLVAFGLQIILGHDEHTISARWKPFFVFCAAVFLLSLWFVPAPLKLYVYGLEFLWGIAAGIAFLKPAQALRITLFLIVVAFGIEWMAVSVFMHSSVRKEERPLEAMQINGLDTTMPLVVDFQNPKILPFREFDRVDLRFIEPDIYSYQNNFGLFYQFGTLARFMHGPSLYRPMPMAYATLYQDREMQWYLVHNPRTFSLADYAAPENRLNFYNVLASGLYERVAMVDRREKDAEHLTDPAQMSFGPRPADQRWKTFTFDLKAAQVSSRGDSLEYGFKLPDDFPRWLSTTVFTPDYESWKLSMGGQSLAPVQGKLIQDYTFDVQNVREEWLILRLPKTPKPDGKIELQVKMPQDISDVWQNGHDRLGITYEAWRDGWLIIHYPYDPKWEISIDGKPSRVYRVNRYFIGTPISQGIHKVLLSYWPHTPLRLLLFLSLIGVWLGFIALMIYLWRSK
jgi:hypothetical protein